MDSPRDNDQRPDWRKKLRRVKHGHAIPNKIRYESQLREKTSRPHFREQQVLELIWLGLKNREIAGRLKISIKTVEAHRATVMKKVRVSNTARLLKAAIQDRLIPIGQ